MLTACTDFEAFLWNQKRNTDSYQTIIGLTICDNREGCFPKLAPWSTVCEQLAYTLRSIVFHLLMHIHVHTYCNMHNVMSLTSIYSTIMHIIIFGFMHEIYNYGQVNSIHGKLIKANLHMAVHTIMSCNCWVYTCTCTHHAALASRLV